MKKTMLKMLGVCMLAVSLLLAPLPVTKGSFNTAVTVNAATMGQRNALSRAKSYLRFTYFSKKGLIEQLEYEGYSKKEATYGAKKCGVNWNTQAKGKAKSYLKSQSFSKSGLIEQLEYEGFTSSQAKYGVKKCGANWNKQAAKKAKSYLRTQSFSKSGLIEQLEYEGFTSSQARYGAKKAGF